LDDAICVVDGEEFPPLSLHLFDKWDNFNFPIVVQSLDIENDVDPKTKKKSSKKNKSSSSSSSLVASSTKSSASSADGEWEVTLVLRQCGSDDLKPTLECESDNVRMNSRGDIIAPCHQGAATVTGLTMNIPKELWLEEPHRSAREMSFDIAAFFKLNRPGVEKDDEDLCDQPDANGGVLRCSSVRISVKVKASDSPVEFGFYSQDGSLYSPVTLEAGSEFVTPDVKIIIF
jgi:hypothetical protein